MRDRGVLSRWIGASLVWLAAFAAAGYPAAQAADASAGADSQDAVASPIATAQEMEDPTPAAPPRPFERPFALERAREAESVIQVGGGFTAGPTTLLTTFELSHFVADGVAIGPLLQLGVSDDDFIIAPTLNVKAAGAIDDPGLDRIRPFVQGGLGFAYIDKDGRRGSRDDVGLLLNFGFGAELLLTDRLSIGSNVLFNVLPGEVRGETFFFSWQLITFGIRF